MIKYSEIFGSHQGEGLYVGTPSVWLRFFLCNLQCDGFGQKDPTDPSTYELPYKDIDISSITKLEDIPILSKGCDSGYSWAAKFKHLQHEDTPGDLARKIVALLPNKEWGETHFCVTGGEPLLKQNQQAFVDLWYAFMSLPQGLPKYVTFETNGTRVLTPEMQGVINSFRNKTEFFFSISPKLFNVSGEKDAIQRNVIKQYNVVSSAGQLKFVVNGTSACWDELEGTIKSLREVAVTYPVILMPVGATKEQQENVSELVNECFKRGYKVTPRAHCTWHGNGMGT